MLQRSQFIYFFAILAVITVAGFFICNTFVSSNIFTASLQSQKSLAVFMPNTDQISLNSPDNQEEVVQAQVAEPLESLQDQLDDIQEKLDIIQQKVDELIARQKVDSQSDQTDEDNIADDENDQDVKEDDSTDYKIVSETIVCTGQININTASAEDLDKITEVGAVTAQRIIAARPFYSLNDLLKVSGIGQATLQKIIDQGCAYVGSMPNVGGGGGGGSAPVVYSKILISEVQISPIGQRFVELYNSNSADVNLTGWYLQRKTSDSWNSFVSSTKFAGKIIPANGYFLISRSDTTADILFSDMTLTQNNFLALKSPDEKIVDQASWSTIADGLSWCTDFSLCSPTPKAQNIIYVVPALPPSDNAGSNDITPPPADTNLPSITTYTFNGTAQNITVNPTINPVQINLIANENVNWMYVRVVNVSDPTIYKTFGSGVGCVNGTTSCSKTWNGGISHGTALINGNYQIKVHIKDLASNEFEDYISPYIITVNTTL